MNLPPVRAYSTRATFLPIIFATLCCAYASEAAAAACEDMERLARPGTVIKSSRPILAGAFTPPTLPAGPAAAVYAALPAFCRVTATLMPSRDSEIQVEVWLPISNWNGKLQAVGNGGMAGVIPYAARAAALAGGYATAGTDTGHVGNNAVFVPGHPEKLVDFAYRAIHEMTVTSKAIIGAHYGAAPTFSYFNGCSQGGRQAITSAQRYPQDFDGIVAGASAWNSMRMHGARLAVNRVMNRTADSAIPASKYPMIHNAVLRACDELDGVKDGVLENPTQCTFDFKALECKAADSAACLTPSQVESARAMISPVKHPSTGAILFEGHLWYGAELGWGTIGGSEPLRNAVTALANIAFDPSKWDFHDFNIGTDIEVVADVAWLGRSPSHTAEQHHLLQQRTQDRR